MERVPKVDLERSGVGRGRLEDRGKRVGDHKEIDAEAVEGLGIRLRRNHFHGGESTYQKGWKKEVLGHPGLGDCYGYHHRP